MDSFSNQMELLHRKLDASIGGISIIHSSEAIVGDNIFARVATSVDAAIEVIKDLQEKLEDSLKTRNSLSDSFKEISEKIKDLEQTNELAAYVIHEVFDNLQKIVNGSTEESEDDTRNEQLDHLEINNYDVFIERLIMILRERAQLETKNREYNLDLLRRIKDLEESNRKLNNPAKDLKLMELQTKIEEDGRVFPVSDNSSTIVDCLLNEARQRGVTLQTGKYVTSASISQSGKFILKIEKRTIDYGYNLANKLGHSIIKPIPSIFTFKIDDIQLTELSGASLKLESLMKNIPQLTQVGPMLVTHWGLSGPVILCLSAWGPVIFLILFIKALLSQHKKQNPKQKVGRSYPQEFGTMKRFWKYLLNREGIDEDILWASISNNSLMSIATLLKQCSFLVKRKG